jgi:hypothetical protein
MNCTLASNARFTMSSAARIASSLGSDPEVK